MWIPDRGTAESASWRIARRLRLRHDGIRVGWRPGPDGVDYDPMMIQGRSPSGDFEILINRTGSIRVIVEVSEDEVDETLTLAWDEVLRRSPGEGWLERPFEEVLTRIERAAGLRSPERDRPAASDPSLDPEAYALSVLGVLTSVHSALERPVRSSTVTALTIERERMYGTHALFERFPGLLADVRSRFRSPDDERQVWKVSVLPGDFPPVVIDPTGPRAWVDGLDRPVDLLALGGRPDALSADPARAALRLLGPVSELEPFTVAADAPAATTVLGYGIVEAPLRPWSPLPVLSASIERGSGQRDEAADRTEEGSGPWVVRIRPLLGPDLVLRSHRGPESGPEVGGVRFFLDDEPMLHRGLVDSDASWVGKYDIGLGDSELTELFEFVADLRDDLDEDDDDRWATLATQRDELEDLSAMVAPGGHFVYGLRYTLANEDRMAPPLFRDGDVWDDAFPPQDDRWHEEALRVARERDPLVDEDLFEAADEAFEFIDDSEHVSIHPTMARMFLDHFGRGLRIPVELARLAAGPATAPPGLSELASLGRSEASRATVERMLQGGRVLHRSDLLELLLRELEDAPDLHRER